MLANIPSLNTSYTRSAVSTQTPLELPIMLRLSSTPSKIKIVQITIVPLRPQKLKEQAGIPT